MRLARRAAAEFVDDRCAQYAAAISYHVLFSIFPLAIVTAGVFGVVVRATGTRANAVDTIVGFVPLSASGDADLRRLLDGATGGLSALGLLGLVGVVYAASGMMTAIRLALNEAWDVERHRPFLKGKLVDVTLVVAAASLALASLAAAIAVRVAGAAGGALGVGWAGWLLGIAVPLATAFAAALFLYLVVPAAEVRPGDAWGGALLVACAFVLLETLFAVYVQHFANYNAVYGSLGAVIAFMFFVYLSSLVFLFGAEVASEWPRVRAEPEPARAEQGPPLSARAGAALRGLWARQQPGRR